MSKDKDEAKKIEPGAVVKLWSGGPMMTVEKISGGNVDCVWIDKVGEPEKATFGETSLKVAFEAKSQPQIA